MPAIRKAVLDDMRAMLSDPVYGFNVRFAAARAGYQLAPVEIDWAEDSQSVFYGGMASVERTGISGRLTLRIATKGSKWTGETKGMKWSGVVEGQLVFTVTSSHAMDEADGIEVYDIIERWKAAIEDVVIEIFARPVDRGEAVAPFGRPDCPEMPNAELFADGWEQEIPINILYRVNMVS